MSAVNMHVATDARKPPSSSLAAPVSSGRLLKRLHLRFVAALWVVASIGTIVGIWEFAAAMGWADPLLMPAPHVFLATGASNFTSSTWPTPSAPAEKVAIGWL